MNLKIINDKITTQISAGIFGGTILGMMGFLQMMRLGSRKEGCFPCIDSFFNSAGYESCGAFGGLTGIILGCIFGIILINLIFKIIKIANYFWLTFFILVCALFFPFLHAVLGFFPDSIKDGDVFIVFPITLIFVIFSILPAVIFTAIAEIIKKIHL